MAARNRRHPAWLTSRGFNDKTKILNMDNNEEKFEPMGTKVAPWAAVVWNAICEALETDTYHLLQHFIYAMIRGASSQHEKSPEIQRLLDALDLDVGWQNAINLCAPDGKLSIAQMILIVEQKDKHGFSAVMLDKPFMGECLQTENVDKIFERLTEVIFKREYIKLRQLGIQMNVKSQRELLETMIDAQTIHHLDEELAGELPGVGDRAQNGRVYAYGKKTKTKQRRTPDGEAQRQQRIQFTDEDRKAAEQEADRADLEKEMGFKPHGIDW